MDKRQLDEFRACLALTHSRGLGLLTQKKLLDHYGSAMSALGDLANWSGRGLTSPAVSEAVRSGAWRDPAEEEWSRVQGRGLRVLLWTDPTYPERLRQIQDPPAYLYYDGDMAILQRPVVAIVGSRACSASGLALTRALAEGLSAAGVAVASGFALGIDRQAHQSALKDRGSSIGVLGTGLDLIYPAVNRDLWEAMCRKGLLLTEFAPGTRPETHNFPRRNRIISGLSLGVVVVEAAAKSGSLITARLALDQNREVFAVPGPVQDARHEGCHKLIRQGAVLVRTVKDVLDELGPMLESGPARPGDAADRTADRDPGQVQDLDPEQRQLVSLLKPRETVHLDHLTRLLDWPSGRTSQVLTRLEILGVVSQLPGMYYRLA